MKTPQEIVNAMMERDRFSQHLDFVVLSVVPGGCEVRCEINEFMLNGMDVAHGGIAYSLSDSALAFAANAHGYRAFSIETCISHYKTCILGDTLVAKAKQLHRSNRVGSYEVSVFNQREEIVAHFKGTVYHSDKEW